MASRPKILAAAVLVGSWCFAAGSQPVAAAPPNIVLVMADNLGYGEPGCYGGGMLRGAPTPRIDGLAGQGTRLLNFCVESQCTPSRSALLTGRFAMRSGTMKVKRGGGLYGLVQWEITLAEILRDLGYATGIFGKWHLGDTAGRFPTDQGFDEWYGIPNTTNVAAWPTAPGFDPAVAPVPHVLEARRGETPKELQVYDLEQRRLIDTEITRRSVEFIRRTSAEGRPFFCYVPFTLVHYPTLPHPDFRGRTGAGEFADSLAEMDHHVGEVVDAVKAAGAEENTIFIFTSDNGPEEEIPWRGWAGPWAGSYFTAMEGSCRVPFVMRWPGRVPAGRVSNEIVHQVDLFTTLAKLAGGDVPADRIVDGLDQREFLAGRSEKSAREGFPCYVGDVLHAVKWRNWKVHFVWQEYKFDPPLKLSYPRVHDLLADPQERHSVAAVNMWVLHPVNALVRQFEQSLEREPPIPPGAADPWVPAGRQP